MSVEAASVAVRGAFAQSPWYTRIRLEHVVMGGAIVALIVLVVLPLPVAAARQPEGRRGPEPRPLQRGADRPALRQRAEELADPRRLDRAVQPDHRPAAGLGGEPHRRAGEAADPGHRDAVLPVAAVPDRDRVHLPVQPERRPDQRADARRARPALADLQRLLDAGPGAGHGAAHLPVRLSAGVERAAVGRCVLRGGGADPRRQQAAHRVLDHRAAGRAGDPVRHAARLRQRASRCSARRRSSACRAASSRCRPASTRCSTIRRNTGSPRRCRWCSS